MKKKKHFPISWPVSYIIKVKTLLDKQKMRSGNPSIHTKWGNSLLFNQSDLQFKELNEFYERYENFKGLFARKIII